jgi:hypothetical protein
LTFRAISIIYATVKDTQERALNSQGKANIPGDLRVKLQELCAGSNKGWRDAARVAFDCGFAAMRKMGGLRKAGPVPETLNPGVNYRGMFAENTRLTSLPTAQVRKLDEEARREGMSWQQAQRIVLYMGILGLESVGGLRGYYEKIEADKAEFFANAGAKFRTAV